MPDYLTFGLPGEGKGEGRGRGDVVGATSI